MSNDPYGYGEETPAAPADLSRVLWYGVGALLCAALGPCLCYLPYIAAIPLGWMAIQQSKAARASAVPLERTVGSVAQTSGVVGLAFGVLALSAIVIYALIFGGAMLMAAIEGTDEEPYAPDVILGQADEANTEPLGAVEGEGLPAIPTAGDPSMREGGGLGGQWTPTPPPDALQE
jgi:hypothetical protein